MMQEFKNPFVLHRQTPGIIWTAIFLHAWFGFAILVDADARFVTTLVELSHVAAWKLVLLFWLASVLALLPVFRKTTHLQHLLCLSLQQGLLLLSLLFIGGTIWRGAYGDSTAFDQLVQRPRMFITTDQSAAITLSLCHTWSLIQFIRNPTRWTERH